MSYVTDNPGANKSWEAPKKKDREPTTEELVQFVSNTSEGTEAMQAFVQAWKDLTTQTRAFMDALKEKEKN